MSHAAQGESVETALTVEPRAFWDQFVWPAIEDWFHHEGDVRRATIALCELDNFAEHMLLFLNPSLERGDVGRERNGLCTQVPELGLARDIHDTHKHGRLTRRTATITRPQEVRRSFQPFHYSGLPRTELLITDDAGKHYRLGDIIWKCRDYWRGELVRNGLLAD